MPKEPLLPLTLRSTDKFLYYLGYGPEHEHSWATQFFRAIFNKQKLYEKTC